MNKLESIKRSIKLNICSLFGYTHVVNMNNNKVHSINCRFGRWMDNIKCIKSNEVKNYIPTKCKLCK
jgi:hypothetical protein